MISMFFKKIGWRTKRLRMMSAVLKGIGDRSVCSKMCCEFSLCATLE